MLIFLHNGGDTIAWKFDFNVGSRDVWWQLGSEVTVLFTPFLNG